MAGAAATQPTQQAAPQPGSAFGYPGQTIEIFQEEDTFGLGYTPATGAQVPVNGILPMRKTDVVAYWRAQYVNSLSVTGTPTVSPYAPYSLLGPTKLTSQNQVTFVDVQNGVDLYSVNYVHPMYPRRNITTPYLLPNSVQSTIPGQTAPTTSAFDGTLEIVFPGALWFENYLDLSLGGQVQAPGHGAIVSPQYMSGTKTIQLQSTLNPGVGSDFSNGLWYGGTTPAVTGTGSLNLYRQGWLQTAAPFLPLVYGVQRNVVSQVFPIGAQTSAQITLPQIGQVGWIGLRFYDPTSASNSLTPPVNYLNLKIAGGIYRFQDTPSTNQGRLLDQHGTGFPQGTMGWDLWIDSHGRRNNAGGLDTINTAAPTIEIKMGSALSSEAQVIVTYDALSWIGG